ncbi:hypothetical protein SPRG_04522 [Saprolegnia parasitica CBS 223.65]|uniref:Alpha-ketoglutarate-dependent dioxygenase AlkB-like domain-containing protein n=1 Tax=Saprolegnia parasitica (strain CBS 223.65) TaxID=695850 RepID=A0A067CV22_SAPPC|nr:hypothetical protein SPRG_04522 [Saprolegnia parasitica CBS 223.65]KDO30622.1 hypothetical protein SPRG_04522 [Saprolegnia parasitica CBS 223.65]|eukprot:XP_012198833.1 hypothetical protein SPRG_04522 [Saprolegnia parasitica CBS 223.65]
MLRPLRCMGLRHRLVRRLSTAPALPYSWATSDNVDRSLCCDPFLQPSDLQVMTDVISEDDEQRLADEAATLLRRRRYETDHWDQVIVNFKEMETTKWSAEANAILAHLRSLPVMPPQLTYFPTVHVIDLAEAGYIKPHVDSIKFSGQIVAGISLLSPSVMRFKEEVGRAVAARCIPAAPIVLLHEWRRPIPLYPRDPAGTPDISRPRRRADAAHLHHVS